ncbi:hypothetical protein KALB_4573 [Kutzneria albida DSM 43870]|uniref:Uncharacterized protein n=1 Tax=Kutzneria albida DSM 43870 TaxID=1449976 RepID=W5WAZ6_9PSEU|nr:hypothetical protein KALB_4573 [Kutzneria albida DSM 43870]
MPLTPEFGPRQEAAARRLLLLVALRTARSEGLGILQVWQSCGQQQARADMHALHSQGTEAIRMIGAVDAAAEGLSDPDAGWE